VDPITDVLMTILGVGGGGGTTLLAYLGLQKIGLIKNGNGNGSEKELAEAQEATAKTLTKTVAVLERLDQKLDQIVDDTKNLPTMEIKLDHLAKDVERVETKVAAG
jgi:hypothetical protein